MITFIVIYIVVCNVSNKKVWYRYVYEYTISYGHLEYAGHEFLVNPRVSGLKKMRKFSYPINKETNCIDVETLGKYERDDDKTSIFTFKEFIKYKNRSI